MKLFSIKVKEQNATRATKTVITLQLTARVIRVHCSRDPGALHIQNPKRGKKKTPMTRTATEVERHGGEQLHSSSGHPLHMHFCCC